MSPLVAVRMAPEANRISRGAECIVDKVLKKNNRGKSFCQVERRKHKGQDNPAITLGNQK